MLHRIDLPHLRGYVDDEGRRRGIWVARVAEGWLVEVYGPDGELVQRRKVKGPLRGPSMLRRLASG